MIQHIPRKIRAKAPPPRVVPELTPLAVLLRKRHKIAIPTEPHGEGGDSCALILSIDRNIGNLGFGMTRRLAGALATQTEETLARIYSELIDELRRFKGAHVEFQPMYPNFPTQVMEMTKARLYWNAIFHYWTLLSPNDQAKEERLPLSEQTAERVLLDLGNDDEYRAILTDLACANASLSESDKDILSHLIRTLPDALDLLPPEIPQRETRAIIAASFLQKDPSADIIPWVRTATDVLRVATWLSGGDISLAVITGYGKFQRPLRRKLLAALENCGPALEEDMLRHKGKWIRLGERLHPGEYATRFPRTHTAFTKLREEERILTFASRAEELLQNPNAWKSAVELFQSRPGEFLRRLDHILRAYPGHGVDILEAFLNIAPQCGTPALVGLHAHFRNRQQGEMARVAFPKGPTAKMYALPPQSRDVGHHLCQKAVEGTRSILHARFAALPPLGRVFIAPELARYPVPFAQRSASRVLKTLPRGSRIPLQGRGDTLRFFIHWKNMPADVMKSSRVDLDLSAVFLAADFTEKGHITYYNLRHFGGCHSGDITNAPDGAAEFIDVSIDALKKAGVHYVGAVVNSYTGQPYCDVPECFCGWMVREKPRQGEIFEPRTVQAKADLTSNSGIVIPVLIDLEKRHAIWCDISLRSHPCFVNNVRSNKQSLNIAFESFVSMRPPTLHELLDLHAAARGDLVASREEADTLFGEEFAYEGDRIAAEFLA